MKQRKILYIKAQGMGDIITSIPKFYEWKKQGNHITILWYSFEYFKYGFTPQPLIDILERSGLVDNIIYIPYNKLSLVLFLIKNFRKFDLAFNPIKTKFSKFLGNVLSKKYFYVFNNRNDNKKFKTLIDGETEGKAMYLYEYKKYLILGNYKDRKKIYDIKEKYITIFPSSYERSIDIDKWIEVIEFINKNNIQVIILGGERDKWFIEDLQNIPDQKFNIKDLINKTEFYDLCDILENSVCNILCNGGVMRLGNLMNKKNINIHTVSSFVQEPKSDYGNSFNIRPYTYQKCVPCEASGYRQQGTKGIPSCVFTGTKREGECRDIDIKLIIKYIEKILKD